MKLTKQTNERTHEHNFTLTLTDAELIEVPLTPQQRVVLYSWPNQPLAEQMLILACIAKLIAEPPPPEVPQLTEGAKNLSESEPEITAAMIEESSRGLLEN